MGTHAEESNSKVRLVEIIKELGYGKLVEQPMLLSRRQSWIQLIDQGFPSMMEMDMAMTVKYLDGN